MLNMQIEMCLTEYYTIRCTAGRLIRDDRALFAELCEIFMTEDSDALYALANGEYVADIRTMRDYAQYCRTRAYYEMNGVDDGVSADTHEMIAIKGGALKKADELKIAAAAVTTDTAVFSRLNEFASLGVVQALVALGYLQCKGIGTAVNAELGCKNFARAAQWNSLPGILFALHFDADSRALNMNRLYTVAQGTIYADLVALAEKRYGVKAGKTVAESVLIMKGIASGVLKADVNAAQYARIIYSDIIDIKDKERTLFSPGEQAVSDTADLPLKLEYRHIECDPARVESLTVKRDEERSRIIRYAEGSDLRTKSAYRPLCISSDSEYLLTSHLRVLSRAFGDAHIERIDVAGLTEYDFEPSANNIFVRSCDEDKNNVYFLIFRGDIDERKMQAACAFLQSGKRKKFRLARPGVVLDLGAIMPVCFCDKANAKKLNDLCDVVTLAKVGDDERTAVINDITASAQKAYGVSEVVLDDGAKNKLNELGVDSIVHVVDRAVRCGRKGDEKLLLDEPAITESIRAEHANKTKYGFGGVSDEI